MTATTSRLEQVSEWLELVEQLPLGHPDRHTYLTQAEELLESTRPEDVNAESEAFGSRSSGSPRVACETTPTAGRRERTRRKCLPGIARFYAKLGLTIGLIAALHATAHAGDSGYEPTHLARIAAAPADARSFFVEFRARKEVGGFGHSYLLLGSINSSGVARVTVIAGFMPKGLDDDRWSRLGLPVNGIVGVTRSDLVRKPVARIRLNVNEATYHRFVAQVLSLRKTWGTYEVLLRNCNSFVGEVASAGGLRVPILSAQLPVMYIEELRQLNGSR